MFWKKSADPNTRFNTIMINCQRQKKKKRQTEIESISYLLLSGTGEKRENTIKSG